MTVSRSIHVSTDDSISFLFMEWIKTTWYIHTMEYYLFLVYWPPAEMLNSGLWTYCSMHLKSVSPPLPFFLPISSSPFSSLSSPPPPPRNLPDSSMSPWPDLHWNIPGLLVHPCAGPSPLGWSYLSPPPDSENHKSHVLIFYHCFKSYHKLSSLHLLPHCCPGSGDPAWPSRSSAQGLTSLCSRCQASSMML